MIGALRVKSLVDPDYAIAGFTIKIEQKKYFRPKLLFQRPDFFFFFGGGGG